MVPKYRRHPNGSAFVQHKSIATSDHRMYLGKYGTPESKRRYEEFIRRLNDGVAAIAPASLVRYDKTIAELVSAFLPWAEEYYQRRGKPTTYVGGLRRALGQLYKHFHSELGRDFTPAKLEGFQKKLVGDGFCRVTVNCYVRRVKVFFAWACRYGEIPGGICHELASVRSLRPGRFGAKERPKVRAVPWANVQKLLPYVAPQVATMLQVQYLSGMRPEEVCAMRPKDIDRSEEIWWYRPEIEWIKTSWRYLNTDDAEQVKALPPAAQKLLEPYLNRDEDACLFSPREAEEWRYQHRPPYQGRERKTKVFPCERKRREEAKRRRREQAAYLANKRDAYDTSSYRRAILYGIKRAQQNGVAVDGFSPNQIRHAIATDLKNFTHSQETAQQYLGHRQLNTTGIYAEKQMQRQAEIAMQVQEIWNSHQGKKARTPEEIAARKAKKKRKAAKLARMERMMEMMLKKMDGEKEVRATA